MLTEVTIKNFKSIEDATIPLQPLTVFIGANNSGKSNFFSALESLSRIAYGDPPGKIIWESQFFNHNMRAGITLGCKYQIESLNEQIDYLVELSKNEFLYEKINIDNIPYEYNNSNQQSSVLKLMRGKHGVLGFLNSVASAKIYKLWTKNIADVNTINPNPVVSTHGDNITSVLDWIRGEHPGIFTKIEEELKRCIPEIEHIILKTINTGVKQLAIKEKYTQKPFVGSEISDGILIFMALLTIIYHPTETKIICLDEPENGIHVGRMREVVDYLTHLAYHADNKVQILISTHSPYFLDHFKERIDEVIIVEKHEGKSKFTPLSEYKDIIEGELPLGEIWFSGLIGGVPK